MRTFLLTIGGVAAILAACIVLFLSRLLTLRDGANSLPYCRALRLTPRMRGALFGASIIRGVIIMFPADLVVSCFAVACAIEAYATARGLTVSVRPYGRAKWHVSIR